MVTAEGVEPWDVADVGVDVVMFHLGAARTMAQLGAIYSSNAQSKLKCTCGVKENLIRKKKNWIR